MPGAGAPFAPPLHATGLDTKQKHPVIFVTQSLTVTSHVAYSQ